MFDIDHAFRFCSESKTSKWQKLNIVLELEEFLLSLVSLETSKRGFVFAPREGTWNEALREEWNGKIALCVWKKLIKITSGNTQSLNRFDL